MSDRLAPEGVVVACCQTAPRIGDVTRNLELEREAVGSAVAAGAGVIVLPELSRTGYVFATRDEAAAVATPAEVASFAHWIEALDGGRGLVVGGFVEEHRGRLYNAIAAVDTSGLVAVYRKVHLWNGEPRWFEAGTARAPVIDVGGARVGLAVCYDLFFPELMRDLSDRGADIVVCPTSSAADVGASATSRDSHRGRAEPIGISVTRAQAHMNRVWIAVADRCGTERGVDWNSRTVIVDPEGSVAAQSSGSDPEIVVVSCDLGASRRPHWSGTHNGPADLRRDLYPPTPS